MALAAKLELAPLICFRMQSSKEWGVTVHHIAAPIATAPNMLRVFALCAFQAMVRDSFDTLNSFLSANV